MNRQNYRAAFDAVDFSPDFEERTLQKLAAMRHASEKEQNKMSMNRTKKITLLAAAAVALLAVTVSAAVLWLTPAQVAEELNDPMLAEAFQSEAAVILNETQTVGDYTVTLMGMVSGANISQWCADVQESRTYAVVSVVRTDGTPLTEENYDVVPCGAFTVTPLVSGYDPRAVNVFTLNGACSSFLRDGRAYYVLDTQSLEIFSDHTVYLALYEGFAAPSYERFSLAEDGTVDLRDNVTGCMFTLPLDTHTADPDAARAFVESTGIPWEPMTDAQLAVQEAHEDLEVEKSADGVGNQTFLISGGQLTNCIQQGRRGSPSPPLSFLVKLFVFAGAAGPEPPRPAKWTLSGRPTAPTRSGRSPPCCGDFPSPEGAGR